MFLDALILILQEIIEANLLIAVLLVLGGTLQSLWPDATPLGARWVYAALGLGLVGALLYGWMMPVTANWFDYAGYEVLNALMQTAMILLLVLCVLTLEPAQAMSARIALAKAGMVVIVALGIVREGSEIILYVNGVLGSGDMTPVTLGGLMAAGIGCSGALLLYYFLSALPPRLGLRTTLVLLALFAGNMAAQAALLLTQADRLPYTPQAWDSSWLLSEQGIAGQLLYALVGYDANPAWLQVVVYVATAACIALTPLFRRAWTLKESS